jgi:site-specific DNA-methyltransferase (adenine-specific)
VVETTLTAESQPLSELLAGFDAPFLGEARAELASLVNWSGPSVMPVHRWLRYREGFSPLLIEALDLGDRILDPFAGSGSIMVGAAQQHRSSVGIEVNPLAAFAAKVKLTPLTGVELDAVRNFAAQLAARVSAAVPAPLPELKIARKVFEPEIADVLLKLETAIETFGAGRRVRNFLWLARLSILEEVGSYFKEGNGIKYRNRKRLKHGYVRRIEGMWQSERFGTDQRTFVLAAFSRQLSVMLDDVSVWTQSTAWAEQTILPGSCVTEMANLASSDFDSIVFSPPYANRFDYFEAMKVELWFGRFVRTYEEMSRLRKLSLRSHLGSDLRAEDSPIAAVDALLDLIDAESYAARVPVRDLVHGYFADMRAVLSECRRVLRPGGACHIIVGNSAYGGVIIPTDAVLAQIGSELGFSSAVVSPVRHLTVAPQQRAALSGQMGAMRESLVTLR